jgi:hypothetical protein
LDPGCQVIGTLSTIAVSPLDAEVIVTGSDDGQVHVTDSGGTIWDNVSAGLPLRWITSVRCDPFARETIYATISGLRWDEPLPHVFRSDNLGADWEPIAGNLPEAPVNDLLPHPDNPGQLFVATDLGVFGTSDGGATWSPVADGLPNVVVFHLAWNASRDELVAGTFGRSIFTVSIPEATPVADQVVLADVGRVLPAFPNPTSGGTTLAWELARTGEVSVQVFSVRGRRIFTTTGNMSAGAGSLFWDGRDHRGRPAAAGIYLVRVSVDGRILGRSRVVLTR